MAHHTSARVFAEHHPEACIKRPAQLSRPRTGSGRRGQRCRRGRVRGGRGTFWPYPKSTGLFVSEEHRHVHPGAAVVLLRSARRPSLSLRGPRASRLLDGGGAPPRPSCSAGTRCGAGWPIQLLRRPVRDRPDRHSSTTPPCPRDSAQRLPVAPPLADRWRGWVFAGQQAHSIQWSSTCCAGCRPTPALARSLSDMYRISIGRDCSRVGLV